MEDSWLSSTAPHRVWPTPWTGTSSFEATDGSWQSVRHEQKRHALMTPTRVSRLKLPPGVQWTGRRRTVIHPIAVAQASGAKPSATSPQDTRDPSGNQPTVFTHEGQGHKRRTQQQCESTLTCVDWPLDPVSPHTGGGGE